MPQVRMDARACLSMLANDSTDKINVKLFDEIMHSFLCVCVCVYCLSTSSF